MSEIDGTLDQRGTHYGEFNSQAYIPQRLKEIMRSTPGWTQVSSDKREALEMIQHKIARILNGDPEFRDSWHDIVGYARLIEVRLDKN